jgi:hypothetical protein
VGPKIIRAAPEVVADKNRLSVQSAKYILIIDAKSLEIISLSASEFNKHYSDFIGFKS